ncbi:MAG: exosortase-associated EpsI family protein [Lentisphaerales bacterium]|nr:MAG: exosortase-associated EpsI family protein [Lentisphaerales bacterium]
METGRQRRLILVIALLAAMCAFSALQPGIRQADELGVLLRLPDILGEYSGDDLLYCQDEQCLHAFTARQTGGADACPDCGGPLFPISLAESVVLPPDTTIVKKLYTDQAENQFLVTIVVGGAHQKSIHRPQQCLPAQGYTIQGSRVLDVPLEGRPPLKVMLLDLHRSGAGHTSYAYWFVGIGRETYSHLYRLWWMAVDRTFFNVMQRWAYVAVATDCGTDPHKDIERLVRCIGELYPQIVPTSPTGTLYSATEQHLPSGPSATNMEGEVGAPRALAPDEDLLAELLEAEARARTDEQTQSSAQ